MVIKMAKYIEKQEIDRQKEFIAKLAENSGKFFKEHGRAPLANTETYGCQQNENDTERIRGILSEAGYEFTQNAEEADIVVYNTCAVRENAEQKVFGRIGILKHIKEHRPDMIICLCGCMVQQEHITKKIKKLHNHIDLIFGPHELYRFGELLYEVTEKKKAVVSIPDADGAIAEGMPILREPASKAWVSVMYGCNNFCSYCIVPYVRGRERSRKPEQIIKEIKELVADGVSEITLLGQNVNSYGKDLDEEIDFADLLKMVNEIEGIKRIRFMTSHPKDISDKLIDTMAECSKVCRQLHLPFQAGSDKVLADMNRRYTKEDYLKKIEKVKAKMPDIALSTDVIVGFPTETTADFEETLDVLKKVEFDNIFSFIYSKREGTPAAKLDFALTDAEIHENFNRLLEVQNEISLKKNMEYVGTEQLISVDEVSKNNPEMLTGRTESLKAVNFRGGKELLGKYVKVKITEAHTWSLNAELG